MCLACEMDGWWFAEMEAVDLKARTASPLPDGERSAASDSETPGEGRSDDRAGENPSPGSRGDPTSPQRGEVKSTFVCEETRSE